MAAVEGVFLVVVLILLLLVVMSRLKQQCEIRAKLPPGSMGWPIIGESLQLFSLSPGQFFRTRQIRFGEIFKTHIHGCPCIMVANPEAVRYVLVSKANQFKPTYPKGKERLIGPLAIFFQQGDYHSKIRKIVQASFSVESIKGLVPKIESIVISILDSWSDGHVVYIFQELKWLAFEVAVLSIFGELDSFCKAKLKENYYKLDKGYNSFPNSVPGTRYHRSLMARKELGRIIGEIIKIRKEGRPESKTLLSHLLNYKGENGQILTDDQISDNVIGVLFAAQDTTASLLTWIIKYISDDYQILEKIKEEQVAIYEMNEWGRRPLTWTQTRTMPFTVKVIQESQRMASIIAFTYREATEDIEYDGYLIPKGWKVLPLFRNIHHNPSYYENPETFNPSRFDQGGAARTHIFMPYGYGVHSCPGNELAKLEILIFIHHLVNNFRWELQTADGNSDRVEYKPFPIPERGLPARFWKIPYSPPGKDD